MKKNKERSAVAQELRTATACKWGESPMPLRFHCSKKLTIPDFLVYGPDLSSNHRLSAIVVSAKKAGLPKALIENSIARGQGKSISGQALEPLTVEAMIPPSIAFIIECQTESKARTLTYVKLAIKDFGGSMATTNHLFNRKGRIVFEKPSSQGNDPLFEQLIDEHTIGADFLDEEKLVIFTEPNQTSGAAEAISKASGRRIESMDIFWDPKPETMVQTMVDTDSENVVNFLGKP